MKATIEIDATPQEMRELLGLPEVQSMQKEVIEKVREKMLSAVDSNDFSELMKLYFPAPEQISAMEGMQKAMWETFLSGMNVTASTPKK